MTDDTESKEGNEEALAWVRRYIQKKSEESSPTTMESSVGHHHYSSGRANPIAARRLAMKSLSSNPIVNNSQRFLEDDGHTVLSILPDGLLRVSGRKGRAVVHFSAIKQADYIGVGSHSAPVMAIHTTMVDVELPYEKSNEALPLVQTFHEVSNALQGNPERSIEDFGAHVMGCALDASVQAAAKESLLKVLSAATNAVASEYAKVNARSGFS